MANITTSKNKLSELAEGESGIIDSFLDENLALKLIEMGVLPGTKVTIRNTAPLGCPVTIEIGKNYLVSMRKSEAQTVIIKL